MRFFFFSVTLGLILATLPLHAHSADVNDRVYVDCGHSDFPQSGSVNTLTFRFFDSEDREVPEATTTRIYTDDDCGATQKFEVEGTYASLTVETNGNDVFLIDRIMGEPIARDAGGMVINPGPPCWALGRDYCDLFEGVDNGGAYCLSTSPAHQVPGIADSCHAAFRFRFRSHPRGRGAFIEPPHPTTTAAQPELTNLARNGRATQSSTYAPYAGAGKAIDGNTDPTWYRDDRNSNSHTNDETDTAWQVDLGGGYNIDHVVVYNGDERSGWWRLTGALVQCWRNEDPATSQKHFYLPDMTDRDRIELDFSGVVCGTVRVVHQGKSRHLVMAEVEVWGR